MVLISALDEQRRIVAYLDGLPPSLRFGDRQAKVNAFPLTLFGDDVRGLQAQSQEELSPSFHFGDAPRDALLPSVPVLRKVEGLDRAFKGEL